MRVVVAAVQVEARFHLWLRLQSPFDRRTPLQYFLLKNTELPDLQWIVSRISGTGGVFAVFDNTTDTIYRRLESPTLMRRNYCKGILLRAILLTHLLDDSFAYMPLV